MPQFDFFAWASVSFWTIFCFQIFYFLMLFFLIAPVSDFTKYIQKLNFLYFKKASAFSLKDFFLTSYFQKI